MNDLNQHHNDLVTYAVKKLCSAIDKIDFNREIPADEAAKIRKEIDEVKATLFSIGDINPDIKNLELFKKGADMVERILNTLTNPHQHLV